MTLVKSNGKQRFPALQGTFMSDPIFSDLMNTRWGMWNRLFGDNQEQMEMIPALNIQDLEKEIKLELAAPGLKKDDFQISMADGVLTISVEKQEKHEEEKDDYFSQEFSYNSFSRSVRLPETVDNDKEIQAKYQDGVLKLTLPKKPNLRQKKQKLIKVL